LNILSSPEAALAEVVCPQVIQERVVVLAAFCKAVHMLLRAVFLLQSPSDLEGQA
jgi:hypothetical protein